MIHVRGKAATIAACACLAATLVVVPSAQAAVTTSSITMPTDLSYLVYTQNTPNTFAASGTSNGTTGAFLDLRCYDGDASHLIASDVVVNANGSFSAPAAGLQNALTFRICKLHAVPAGSSPADPSAFPGPRLLVDDTDTSTIDSGPNSGHLYDFYAYAQQMKGGFDYDSLAGCGIDDSYLLSSSNSLTAVPFYCNDWLWYGAPRAPSRSMLQIDGSNAYPVSAARDINDQASGLPVVKYSYSLDHKTGNFVIHDTEQLVKCPSATWPPTAVTCSSFVATGVTDHRTIVQDHAGLVAWITDVFTSTDGKAHALDLLWENDQHFTGDGSPYAAANVEYQFPGKKSYSTHVLNDAVSLPKRPGTINIRMHAAPDGNVHTARGAIVYDRPAIAAAFNYFSNSQNDFTLHQTGKIPAHGTARFRFAYVQDFTQAKVSSLARQAATIFKGCIVPNVTGKSLAAAKKAVRHANCAVGKISHENSATVASGHVISSKPKAKTPLDYHAKVALVVSTG